MTLFEAIVLGIVQGLTEFIPISSTAHLRIVPTLLGWGDPGAPASAVIQLGTLLAVFVYFAADIGRLIRGFFRGLTTRQPFGDPDSRLAWYVGLGSIPIAVLGLSFKHFIETGARNLWLIAWALIGMAVLLWLAEKYALGREKRTVDGMNFMDAVTIGLGQSLALIPGVSRSGSTITVGLFRNLTHEAAARFSFLLSIPAIAASGLLELVDQRAHLAEVGWTSIAVSVIVSGVVGWASIYYLLRFLRTHTTHVFIWYRIALGVVMIALLATGVLHPDA